jgi:predicted GNAT family acetyltransferase
MSAEYRGKGLAKFFWSKVCRQMFAEGHAEIQSSISFVNIAVINLYAALGFRFRRPVDVYHRMVP